MRCREGDCALDDAPAPLVLATNTDIEALMATVPVPKSQCDTIPAETAKRLPADSLAFGLFFALGLSVFQRLTGLVRSVLFCRLLTDAELGQWSLIFSFLIAFAPLAVLGLPGLFRRYVAHYQHRGQLKTFLIRISAASLFFASIAVSGLLLWQEQVAWLLFRSADQSPLIPTIALLVFAVIIANFFTELMESLRQVRLVSWMRFVSSLVFALAGVSLIFVCDNGVTAVSLGYFAASITVCIPAVAFLARHWGQMGQTDVEPLTHRSLWYKLAPFAAWIWVINILTNLFEISDRYMLLHLSATSVAEAQALVGQYHSGRIIPVLLVGIASLLGGILMPYLSASWELGDRERVGRQVKLALKGVAIGFTSIGVIVLLGSPLLFDWLLEGKYAAGESILPLTFVYCIWMSLAILAQDYLWCAEKGRLPSIAMLVGLVTNLLLNYVLVPRLGLSGAVFATVIANAVALVLILKMNAMVGWTNDRAVWLAMLLPLTLCAPPLVSILALLAAIFLSFRTDLVFDRGEKSQFGDVVAAVRKKVGF